MQIAPTTNKGIPDDAYRKAWLEAGTLAGAARILDVSVSSVKHRLRKLGVKFGTTLLRGTEDGAVVQQWVREEIGDGKSEQIVEAVREALKGVKALPRIAKPKTVVERLMVFYVWGDPHLGQYSWGDETGEDYDIEIAQRLHFDAVDSLVTCTPGAKYGVLVSVGDTNHGDDSTNQTPKSRHALDVDTRYRKVLKATLLTFERCIQRMLQHHEFVEVIIVPGNHDPHASAAIVLALACLYRNNPRVRIDESPANIIYKRFGANLIGVTHGDKIKMKELGGVMAADRKEDWGATEHRHWFTGHIHQEVHIEGRAWSAESLRTLAAKDAFAASHGYRSARDMQAIVFDEFDGEVGRHRVGVKKLEGRK